MVQTDYLSIISESESNCFTISNEFTFKNKKVHIHIDGSAWNEVILRVLQGAQMLHKSYTLCYG